MNQPAPCERIVATLREQLRAKGLRQREVARRLGVSEATVKRYLGGKAVTIDMLQRMAELADLDLLSLASLAQRGEIATPGMTRAQREALEKSQPLRLTYFLLLAGWQPRQIAREFEFTAPRLESLLSRLQELGIVRRLPSLGIQILARPDFQRGSVGDFAGLNVDMGNQFLREMNLRDPNCEWMTTTGRLSPEGVVRLRLLIDKFHADFLALSRSSLDLPPQQTQWYRVFFGARPVHRKALFRTG